MRTLLYLVCVTAALAAVGGCAKKGPEGTWTRSSTTGRMTIRMDVAFTSDGKYQETTSAAGGGNHVTLVQTGTWKVKGDKLTIYQTSAVMNGAPIGTQVAKPHERTYSVDGDRLLLQEGQGRPVTLTRVAR